MQTPGYETQTENHLTVLTLSSLLGEPDCETGIGFCYCGKAPYFRHNSIPIGILLKIKPRISLTPYHF